MAKKKKDTKKRAQRRERAKTRSTGITPGEEIDAQEQAADEAVEKADKAVQVESPARERKAPKPVKEEEHDNAWVRLKAFLREVIIEIKKINWPTTDDTWKSTWVTVVVILFLSTFMGFASLGFKQVSAILFSREPIVMQPTGGAVPETPQQAAEYDPDATPADVAPVADESGNDESAAE